MKGDATLAAEIDKLIQRDLDLGGPDPKEVDAFIHQWRAMVKASTPRYIEVRFDLCDAPGCAGCPPGKCTRGAR